MTPDYELYKTVAGVLIDAGVVTYDIEPDLSDGKALANMPYAIVSNTNLSTTTLTKGIMMTSASVTVNLFAGRKQRDAIEQLRSKVYALLMNLQKAGEYTVIVDPLTTVNELYSIKEDNFTGFNAVIDVTYKFYGG
ncbi:tail terminator [Weissella phage WCP30]|uniref:tail terminator n=1 Tax=Weissella phage WCP30 TaxID=1837862 RepID=UPI0008111339|nr:tail terminator [Weissella phage WCP30]ANU78887.1 hypothetical protein [Weissella phage WCP30]